jgi:tetratricopeptide (TPR) repeat protein
MRITTDRDAGLRSLRENDRKIHERKRLVPAGSQSEDNPNATISAFVAAALKAHKNGEADKAESLFEKALAKAERSYGKDHGAVGLVLITMVDFYEAQGNHEKSKALRSRISEILANYSLAVPLSLAIWGALSGASTTVM